MERRKTRWKENDRKERWKDFLSANDQSHREREAEIKKEEFKARKKREV